MSGDSSKSTHPVLLALVADEKDKVVDLDSYGLLARPHKSQVPYVLDPKSKSPLNVIASNFLDSIRYTDASKQYIKNKVVDSGFGSEAQNALYSVCDDIYNAFVYYQVRNFEGLKERYPGGYAMMRVFKRIDDGAAVSLFKVFMRDYLRQNKLYTGSKNQVSEANAERSLGVFLKDNLPDETFSKLSLAAQKIVKKYDKLEK